MLNFVLKNTKEKSIIWIFSDRFLKAKNRKLPNLGIFMSMLSIMISVAILIIVTSVMNGFRDELLEKILGFNSHISLYKVDNFSSYNEIQNKLKNVKNIKNVSSIVNGTGMLIGKQLSTGAVIKGISKQDLLERKELTQFVYGDISNFEDFSIIIGKGLANQINVKIGDRVNLVVPIVAKTMFGIIPRNVQLKVIGLMNTKAQQYDDYTLLMPLSTAQKVYNMENKVSAIEIITKNAHSIDDVEIEIFNKIKENNLWISDWRNENQALMNALRVEANVMTLLLSLFTVISMFAIFAVIRMMIKSKEREIAILKSHGISNQQIRWIFLIVGFSIAIIGMLFGNLIGIVISLNLEKIKVLLENIFNTTLMDESVYLLSNLPSRVLISDIVKINIFSFIMAIICTTISVRKNTKINITQVLRNN